MQINIEMHSFKGMEGESPIKYKKKISTTGFSFNSVWSSQ